MSTYKTPFSPDDHGFSWPNSFEGEDIVSSWFDQDLVSPRSATDILGLVYGGPPIQLTADMLDITTDEIAEELAGLVDCAGLSAGMCLVALDRYERDLTPWKRKPGRRSQRFADLTRHQFEVFGRWARLGEAVLDMSRPDTTHPWDQARSLGSVSVDDSWPRIRNRLSRGAPVPLMLYRSRWNPFGNDVVIAFGYRDTADNTGRLDIYDPNRPGVGTHLTIDFDRENHFRLEPKSAYGASERKVRGLKRIRHDDQRIGESERVLLAHLAAM